MKRRVVAPDTSASAPNGGSPSASAGELVTSPEGSGSSVFP